MFKKLLLVFLVMFSGVAFAVGPDFSGLTGQVSWSRVIAAVMMVMGGLAGVLLCMFGGELILEKLKGGGVEQVHSEGRDWDKDVYYEAMKDLHAQQRSGVLLDQESARALREFKQAR